ncbi:MAG: protein translocase subunit SecF [Bdellovibrionales bacterium]
MKTTINFLKISKILTPISLAISLLALVLVLVFGFSYGIDFAGGNEIQVQFKEAVKIENLRSQLISAGIEKPTVQKFGTDNEFLIRVEILDDEVQNNKKLQSILSTLENKYKKQGVNIRRIDSVGPQIGQELKTKGILAIVYSLLMILIYLGLRFDVKYAPSSVICLFHDAIITMSIFSIFQLEVNVQTLAAILAIIGYSLNDTIVTFDRIRENQNLFGNKKSFFDLCNQSINEVLSRTLLTSITTLLAISSMWIFADGVIKDFAFTLGLGVIIGTYSSIYVATPLLIFIDKILTHYQQKKSQISETE